MRIRRFSLVVILAIALFTIACASNKPIQIRSTPSGAGVFVDGKPVGVTPLVLTTDDLMPRRAFDGKPSTHAMLVIEVPGYSSYQLVLREFALPNEVNAELRPNISGAAGAASSDPASSPDVVREIERLQQLREKGAILEEEFQQLKKKALDRVSAAPPP